MDGYVDKEDLSNDQVGEEDVKVEGLGKFRVRGLTRVEALHCRGTTDLATVERRMLAKGLVIPTMTENEVKAWQERSAAGRFEDLTDKIAELSGMSEGAAKEAYVAFEEDPGAEFRVLPRREAGDDSDGPEG